MARGELPGPLRRRPAPRLAPGTLSLMELAALRRLRAGEPRPQVARALTISLRRLEGVISSACERFGVRRQKQLLELPQVHALLDENLTPTISRAAADRDARATRKVS